MIRYIIALILVAAFAIPGILALFASAVGFWRKKNEKAADVFYYGIVLLIVAMILAWIGGV